MSLSTTGDSQSPIPAAKDPTVTVIMATYNRAGMIGEAIDSLLGQTRPPDAFYIVDDGSTDNTREIIESYGEQITLLSQANAGRPAAFNRVIPQVTTDYIWLFDDDDIALAHALHTHLEFLAHNPDCDFSYSPHYFFERSTDSGPENKPVLPLPDLSSAEFFLWMMTSHFAPVQLQGMLIPTACYRQVGPFDERLLRSQDRDIMLRIARHFRAGRIETPTWGFRQHDGMRGGPGATHRGADSRYAVWRSYKPAVFTKLRQSLALSEYLVDGPARQSTELFSGTTAYRQALLQRAVIMSIHGLSEEALNDFRAFCAELATSDVPLTPTERKQISELSTIHNLESILPNRYFLGLGKAARPNLQLVKLLLSGTYWSIARELRARSFQGACVMTRPLGALVAGFSITVYGRRHGGVHNG